MPETQELDTNMQYLVYENHSKFITASETIKEVSWWMYVIDTHVCVEREKCMCVMGHE